MTKGIVLFIYGPRPVFLIKAAIWSLRKQYEGPLHVLYYKTDMDLVERIADLPNTSVGEYVPDTSFMDPGKTRLPRSAWIIKAHAHVDQYPFDLNLYYDLDHVWLKPLDDSIFDEAAKHDLVNPWHHYSKPSLLRRIKQAPHVPAMDEYITANGGCVCARKGSEPVKEWMRLIKLNFECGNYHLRKNPEEMALGIMLSTGQAKCLGKQWSTPPTSVDGDIAAIHYTKGRYVRDAEWRAQMREAWDSNFLGMADASDSVDLEFWHKKIWENDEDRNSG